MAPPLRINEGIRFECQGSGRCCVSRGQFGYVYVTLEDRRRLAQYLGVSTVRFTKNFCAKDGDYFYLKNTASRECRFLKANQCRVYDARPTQCRTWPFWPENLHAKTWAKEVAAFCPGVGKGRLWTKDQILETAALQEASDDSAP